MVADIAWRAAVLNPFLEADAPALSPGVVLIDELDLHLHPGWQRSIVASLRRTFPCMQFVATTHSPQVLASARREWVRVLDVPVHDLEVKLSTEAFLRRVDHYSLGTRRLEEYVQGRDSNEILQDVMGVDVRPAEVQAELDILAADISNHRFEAVRQQLQSLEQRLGPDDSAIIKARLALKWEEDTDAAD